MVLEKNRISTFFGARTSGALTWSTPIRFLKQTLGWTIPRVRHPEQADRWTWLVLAAFTQLRLARALPIGGCPGRDAMTLAV